MSRCKCNMWPVLYRFSTAIAGWPFVSMYIVHVVVQWSAALSELTWGKVSNMFGQADGIIVLFSKDCHLEVPEFQNS